MIFCKFDKSIFIFPYKKAVGHRLIALNGTFAIRAYQYGSHVGFCVDKHILLKKLVMKIYSRFHGLEKKFQQHDNYGM